MVRVVALERISVKLPEGFNPDRHVKALLKKIAEQYGEGFELDSIDPGTGVAYATRRAAVTEVAVSTANSFDIRLARGTKPSDGDKVAAKLSDQHEGFAMVRFEPFLGRATLARMDEPTMRCRAAVAGVIGVKPWEVQCSPRPDGGFELVLPTRYAPSKHDEKLAEVATQVVGREGWYVAINAQKLTGSIIPSDPPTFPEMLAFPENRLGNGDPDRISFGRALPVPGQDSGPEITIDWTASAFVLIAGTPGSGKSVLLNAVVSDSLSNGAELVIVDDVSKAIDFEPFRKFCRPSGWGCDSLEGAVAALELVREEGARRAAKLKELGINNWLDMPAGQRFRPILVIVDEVSALLVPDPPMKGVPKDHPLAMEVAQRNLSRAMLQRAITRILSELRFVGVRMVLSTQATNANTGVGPSMRTKIGHSILQGVNPSKAARSQIFADESSVPSVPEHVKGSGKRARGVGVSTLEGQPPAIYKTYFASPSDYEAALIKLGVPISDRPEPTTVEIDRFVPTLESVDSDNAPPRRKHGKESREMQNTSLGNEWMTDPETGGPLTGFAKANAARHAASS